MKQQETNPLSISLTSHHQVSPKVKSSLKMTNKVYGFDKWLVTRLLQTGGNPPICFVLWDGQEVFNVTSKPSKRMFLRDRGALLKLIANPDLQFGELYSVGRLDVEGDLTEFMEIVQHAVPAYEQRSLWTNLLARLYLVKRNTLSRAKDNIYHHYDIGNDFYKLWLDEQMVYTCAYFPAAAMSLEEAQLAKMDYVCRKLRLQADETVVEAGCGWGALALHMAKYYGVRVKAYNISREQIAYARERARQENLADRVEFIEGDYRQIQGDFDAFVSVGMLEHVGFRHFQELGGVIERCLKPTGRGLIHSIGRNRPAPMNAWTEKRIFPGAYPPSLGEMARLFEPWCFSILDVENLRLHYAKTLQHWLERFEAVSERITAMFDPAFVRAWRYYLAGSIATFTIGELQLFQIVFTRFDNNDIPWSRAFMYQDR